MSSLIMANEGLDSGVGIGSSTFTQVISEDEGHVEEKQTGGVLVSILTDFLMLEDFFFCSFLASALRLLSSILRVLFVLERFSFLVSTL